MTDQTAQHPAAPETDVSALTEAERQAWDVDPDLWPHTPPLHIFRALMDEDDNVWWRASAGHGLNAYDAAIERIDELAERLRVVEGERDRLRRWKDEALPVIFGLQDLGKALGLRLGTSITGPDAVEAAQALTARAESAEAAVAGVEALADEWSTPESHRHNAWVHEREAADRLRALLPGDGR